MFALTDILQPILLKYQIINKVERFKVFRVSCARERERIVEDLSSGIKDFKCLESVEQETGREL